MAKIGKIKRKGVQILPKTITKAVKDTESGKMLDVKLGEIVTSVSAEQTRASVVEGTLNTKISTETTNRTNADNALDQKITAEETRAKAAEAAEEARALAAEDDKSLSAVLVTQTAGNVTVKVIQKDNGSASKAIPSATVSNAGVMSADDKVALNNIKNVRLPRVEGIKIVEITPTYGRELRKWQLRDADDMAMGPEIVTYKDQFIKAITFEKVDNAQYLKFVYIDNEGVEQTTWVNMSEMIIQSEFKNGLKVADNGEVSVKLSQDRESKNYLFFAADGSLTLKGIENFMKDIEDDRQEAYEEAEGKSTDPASASAEVGSRWGRFNYLKTQAQADHTQAGTDHLQAVADHGNAVLTTADQGLTDTQKSNARTNIGAAGKSELDTEKAKITDLAQKTDSLDEQINGTPTETKINSVGTIASARIMGANSYNAGKPVFGTSENYSLFFYPVQKGKKYRIKSYNTSSSTGYWSYVSDVAETLESANLLDGKFEEGASHDTVTLFNKVITVDNNFRYIVVSSISANAHSIYFIDDDAKTGGIVDDIESLESGKVDKVTGKTLSTNDYTDAEKAEVAKVSSKADKTDVEDLQDAVYGDAEEVESEVESEREFVSARIEASSALECILFNTSSNTRKLVFYPIEKEKKYKVYSSYISSSTAYWGYSNSIPDSITERVMLSGKTPFVPTPSSSSLTIEHTIESAEDYKYIAISALASSFDDGTAKLTEFVNEYTNGLPQRVENAEDDISALQTDNASIKIRLTTAEGKIDALEKEELTFDVANGNLDESCLVENQSDYYVGYHSVKGGKMMQDNNEDVVVIAHDDLPVVDYIGVRKIYNKYNFKVTFNYILAPFSSATDKVKKIENIRKMIADGHEIGFHATLGSSFFWRNPLYDVTPNGSATFAPTLAEMKTDMGDGKNVFGKNVANATFATMGYSGDSTVKSVLLASATDDQWLTAHKYYTTYCSQKTITGLDLTDTTKTKTYLGWLEYWYNELIDNTLGYSKYDGTIAERFAEDYEGTYPTAAQIVSGELSSCGTFKKGLFKGCHSCCNFEVIDRILAVAEAFTQKFFGLAKFTNAAYHGVEYINLFWTGDDSALYNNRDKSVLASGHTKLYLSARGKTMNLYDLLLAHGIVMLKKVYPDNAPRLEGQTGLIKGQKNIRGAFFSDYNSTYHTNTDQTSVIAKSNSSVSDNITLAELKSWMPDKYEDWLKYAYEHSGENISDSRGTMYVRTYIKETLDKIRSARGTGKIAFLGVDTIKLNSSQMAAVELICQYCYRHNIRMISSNEGMVLSNKERNLSGNLFPNPSFYQSLLEDFGGSSTKPVAYLPDGWISNQSSGFTLSVEKDSNNKVLHLSATSRSSIFTRLYGLSGGKYKFSAMVKTTDADPSCILLSKKMNCDNVGSNASVLTPYLVASSEYTELSYEFTVPEPHKNALDGTLANTLCNGYEDNVAFIQISMIAEAGKETWMYNPKVVKIG